MRVTLWKRPAVGPLPTVEPSLYSVETRAWPLSHCRAVLRRKRLCIEARGYLSYDVTAAMWVLDVT